MPYIIINDKGETPHYFCGQGFRIGVDTTVEFYAAHRFATIPLALEVMKDSDQAYRYANGWRIVPVNRRKAKP